MRTKTVSSVVVVVIVLTAVWLWPFSSYDLSRMHPSIRSLVRPYRSVTAEYYLDGGSVGIDITDQNGQRLQLAIPNYDGPGDKRTYHRLFIGATYASRTGAVEIAFTEDTKRCLADIIGRYATPGPDRDSAVIALRGSPLDYAEVHTRVLLNRFTGN